MNIYKVLDDDFIHLGARTWSNMFKNMAKKAGVDMVQNIVSGGNPGKTIVEDIIPKYQPDLLIIGSLDIKGSNKLFSSQASHMAKNALISVLVVR